MKGLGPILTEAREARGLLTSELAEKLGVRRETIYRWERGENAIPTDSFEDILRVLDVPAKFFQIEPLPPSLAPIFYRSLPSVRRASEVRKAERRLNWLREIVAGIERFVEFPEPRLGSFEGPSDPVDIPVSTIEEQARELRRVWDLGDGAITAIPLLMDNAGIVVSRNHLGVRAIEAFSQPGFRGTRPVVILANDGASPAHTQADCAHELGHLILHSRIDKRHIFDRERYRLMEQQAWRFGRAFLLPANTFKASVRIATLDGFTPLKLSWFTSIALMIKRAEDIGLIDKTTARHLWIQRQQRRWAKVEPFDDAIVVERPRLLQEAVDELLSGGALLVRNWLDGQRLGIRDIANYTDADPQPLIRASTMVEPIRPKLRVAATG